ncbi:unnamed protein product [Didymodactylos carnosus]|uniref:AIG1-type G domain-containing protein n=1 Tax=Didymodactylos carnosus TaxID=1234261 RepID=A0A814Q2G6_9BILA|nr:unnamed protein product [Didymodactylos carnosus]CAF1381387.1 unnamed protein product [Didymodactylos carnosus]CAF3877856.1 unnamed protein product [Didymodactylos carnosus]CAF4189816.1 unnamed protein product [Didymodactylos carnosus]
MCQSSIHSELVIHLFCFLFFCFCLTKLRGSVLYCRNPVSSCKINYCEPNNSKCGLILLGNSGAGKSFIANILLGEDRFQHAYRPTAVTRKTDSAELTIGDTTYAIFDIPGLIEAKQEQIDLNKTEIEKAFQQRPLSIILFVFRSCGGRILDEDLIAFRAINEAYQFNLTSLIFVLNNLDPKRDSEYEGQTTALLQEILELKQIKLCFLDHIDVRDNEARENYRNELALFILYCTPNTHTKRHQIKLHADNMKQLKQKMKQMQLDFQEQIALRQQEIKELQIEYNTYKKSIETEINNLKQKLAQYEKQKSNCIIL